MSSSTTETFTAAGTRPETGSALAASASFALNGSQLMVTLENISTDDVRAPADILQAVYWSMSNNISLSLVSAMTSQQCTFPKFGGSGSCDGTSHTYSSTDGSLSGKYAYSADPTGIGSAGLDAFGGTQGMGYGILSAGDDLTTFNGGMANNGPFAKNKTTFALNIAKNGQSYAPSTVGELNLSHVKFNYGTSPFTIPEPSTLAMVPLAAGLMFGIRRRRRRS